MMKLSLGTVQLGVPYGINNTKGLLSDDEAHELLEVAWLYGFKMLDTSAEYGLAEGRIGRFIREHPDTFEICAKYNASYSKEELDAQQERSRLRMGDIAHYVYYCVDFDVTKLAPGIADGVSVYTVDEARAIGDFKLVQVPASILDGRMDEMIPELQAKGKTVLVRSLLLQGLLASDLVDGPAGNVGNGKCVPEAVHYLVKLYGLATEAGMSVTEMAIRWVWEINPDVAIIGCETPDQVRTTADYWKRGRLPIKMIDRIKEIRKDIPEVVISPRMWGQSYAFTPWKA
jgi:aryl-alcohol dehydrogenase-like predicted oxidoreductase